jgi:succinate dehydrogenase flavin-adding protein (antitoxin of CptAB toxin-antitoxin module)
LLELDLVLLPYAEKIYDLLTDIEKQHHQWLLQQTDMDLQQWLIHKKPASNLLQWQIQHIESIWHFMQTR